MEVHRWRLKTKPTDARQTQRRAPMMAETVGAKGPVVQPLDPSMAVEGTMIIGGNFGGASGSGDNGVGPSTGSSVWNPTHGKNSIVVEEEESREIRAGDAMFHPAAQTLSHWPITREDFVEYLSVETLERFLREHPEVGVTILLAREE